MRAFEIVIEPENIYHIYNRANGSEIVFKTDNDNYSFLEKYARYIHPIVDTYAYCLIPNHFHLMVKIKPLDELIAYFKTQYIGKDFSEVLDFREVGHLISHQFGRLLSSYSQSFNKRNERKGALFMPNFKRKLVDDPSYFAQLAAYIHLNPVKHGLVTDTIDWTFSSYHSYTSLGKSRINTDVITEFFGGKEAMIKYHNNFNDAIIERKGLSLE